MAARESPPQTPTPPMGGGSHDSQGMTEDEGSDSEGAPQSASLAENIDMLAAKADWFHYLGAYQVCPAALALH